MMILKSIQKIVFVLILLISINMNAQNNFKSDKIKAKDGDIEITFIGHGSLMLHYQNKIIQIDPYSKLADYTAFPKADLILLTHHHGDHLDLVAIKNISNDQTKVIMTKKCRESAYKLENVTVMQNNESEEMIGIKIMAVPAYNILNKSGSGVVFHPKGEGNGYVLYIGGVSIYIAGDTENIPEMSDLKNIDIAFLPMNLPYTMTPEMAALAAKSFKPKILYPYHTGDTDVHLLVDLLKDEKGIEIRIREMK